MIYKSIMAGDRLEGYTFYKDSGRSKCYFYFNISVKYNISQFFEIDHISSRAMVGCFYDVTNNISFYKI